MTFKALYPGSVIMALWRATQTIYIRFVFAAFPVDCSLMTFVPFVHGTYDLVAGNRKDEFSFFRDVSGVHKRCL